MRTPMAKGLASMATPWLCSQAKVSRALWPTASTTAVTGILPPSASTTARTARLPGSSSRALTRQPNATSPPRASMRERSPRTTVANLNVPIWGRCRVRISGLAPASTSSSSTLRT